MTQSNGDNIQKKWGDLLQINNNNIDEATNGSDFSGVLFPLIKNISTLSQDLIFCSEEEVDKVKSKVLSENREGSIDSLINDEEFIEKKLEDDEEYKELMKKKGVQPLSAPSSELFYLDFKYSEGDSN